MTSNVKCHIKKFIIKPHKSKFLYNNHNNNNNNKSNKKITRKYKWKRVTKWNFNCFEIIGSKTKKRLEIVKFTNKKNVMKEK